MSVTVKVDEIRFEIISFSAMKCLRRLYCLAQAVSA